MRKLICIMFILIVTTTSSCYCTSNTKTTNSLDEFSVSIFKKESVKYKDKNVFISPYSIYLALSMAYNGAVGTTKIDMAKAMSLNGISITNLNKSNLQTMKSLNKKNSSTILSIANSIWARSGTSFLPDYKNVCSKYYNTDAYIWPKVNPQDKINGWVSEKTHGKIPTIIDRITEDTAAILLNAVYFKGKWALAFKKGDTKKEKFTMDNGNSENVNMMNISSEHFRYYDNSDIQIVSLPYKESDVAAYIILPSKSLKVDRFISSLGSSKLNDIIGKMKYLEGTVKIPKLKTRYSSNLNNTLQEMGMKIPFDMNRADFNKMSSIKPNLYIRKVLHKTYLDMDEKGTEAAAVTAIAMDAGCAPGPQIKPFYFCANRPYIILIRDNASKTTLFMGVIRKP